MAWKFPGPRESEPATAAAINVAERVVGDSAHRDSESGNQSEERHWYPAQARLPAGCPDQKAAQKSQSGIEEAEDVELEKRVAVR